MTQLNFDLASQLYIIYIFVYNFLFEYVFFFFNFNYLLSSISLIYIEMYS